MIRTSRTSDRADRWFAKPIHWCVETYVGWVRDHLDDCPRCRGKLAATGRVYLGLSLLRSQPHSLDLLMRANAKAIGMLKRNIRDLPQADRLRIARPEPGPIERCRKYRIPLSRAAACLAVLLLIKTGLLPSMDRLQADGRKAVQRYYTRHLDRDMVEEIFST